MDNTAKVWDLNSLRCRYTLRGHADSVNSIEFLPYSNTLLTCSADKTLSLWDARTVRLHLISSSDILAKTAKLHCGLIIGHSNP